MKTYFYNILIAADQFANTVLGGNPDETISLRAAHAKAAGAVWGCVLCKALSWVSPGHCDNVRT